MNEDNDAEPKMKDADMRSGYATGRKAEQRREGKTYR